ncbi:MAG: glycosyltransferase family 4 protein [Verrucomicrobiia bacterium]
MRVTHFLHVDGPGGGPKVIRQLLEGLPPTWNQNLVHGGSGPLSAWCTKAGIATTQVPTAHPYVSLLHLGRVRRALLAHRPDIILLHGQWAGPIGSLALRKKPHPPAVYISHCPAFYHSTNLARVVRNQIAESLPCKRCAAVVTLSRRNHYNYLYRGWVMEERLHQICNGLDPDDLPSASEVAAIRRQYFLSPSQNAVFVGRLDEQKRVDWLIEAWDAALRDRCDSGGLPPWHLWIVGDGPARRAVEQKRHHSLDPSTIHLIGSQPDGMSWIAAADVVVMSSLFEGHALVPLEAMACSKPVVSFDTDGIVDSVEHGKTGLLAPLGECEALGKAIAALMNRPALSVEMGRAGRERLIALFPLGNTISSYTTLLNRIVSHRATPLPAAA